MDFLRHKFLEWTKINKRATFGSTLRPFQSVELSLHWLLPSSANVRFAQHSEFNKELNSKTTDTVYRIDPTQKIQAVVQKGVCSLNCVSSFFGHQFPVASNGIQVTVTLRCGSVRVLFLPCHLANKNNVGR